MKVGCRFARISYHMVAGQNVFRHPFAGDRDYIQQGRRRGPQFLGEILPQVLAQLGLGPVQSTASGDVRSRAAVLGCGAENAFFAPGANPN